MKTEFEFEKYGFKMCRICLKPEEADNFISLFMQDGVRAEMIFLLSGVNVRKVYSECAHVYDYKNLFRF